MARDDVDVVGVFTPSGTHGDLAIAAAAAGKHVITTKPPEVTVARVNAMAAAARKAGVLLAVDYQSRYMDDMRRVKQATRRRAAGPAVAGTTAGQSVPHRDVLHRRVTAGLARDLALRWWRLAGEPEHPRAGPAPVVHGARWSPFGRARTSSSSLSRPRDTCQAWLNFASGAWGTIETTTISYGQGDRTIEAQGTNGSIRLTDWRVQEWHFQDEADDASETYGSQTCPPAGR